MPTLSNWKTVWAVRSLDRVTTGKAQIEQMFSGLAQTAEISETHWHFRVVPTVE